MALFVLLFPFLEVYVIYQTGVRIGALNTLGALILMSFLGLSLIKSQGMALVRQSQEALARGEVPKDAGFMNLLTIFAGFLLLIPGFVTDVIAVLCLLPGTRHLLAYLGRKWMQRQVQKGRVFFGGMNAGGFRTTYGQGPFTNQQSYRQTHQQSESPFDERDVTPKVIDVTPISVSTTKDESSKRGSDDSSDPS